MPFYEDDASVPETEEERQARLEYLRQQREAMETGGVLTWTPSAPVFAPAPTAIVVPPVESAEERNARRQLQEEAARRLEEQAAIAVARRAATAVAEREANLERERVRQWQQQQAAARVAEEQVARAALGVRGLGVAGLQLVTAPVTVPAGTLQRYRAGESLPGAFAGALGDVYGGAVRTGVQGLSDVGPAVQRAILGQQGWAGVPPNLGIPTAGQIVERVTGGVPSVTVPTVTPPTVTVPTVTPPITPTAGIPGVDIVGPRTTVQPSVTAPPVVTAPPAITSPPAGVSVSEADLERERVLRWQQQQAAALLGVTPAQLRDYLAAAAARGITGLPSAVDLLTNATARQQLATLLRTYPNPNDILLPGGVGGGGGGIADLAFRLNAHEISEADAYVQARQRGFTGTFNDFLIEKDRIIHQSGVNRAGGQAAVSIAGAGGTLPTETVTPTPTLGGGVTLPSLRRFAAIGNAIRFDDNDFGYLPENYRDIARNALTRAGWAAGTTFGRYGVVDFTQSGTGTGKITPEMIQAATTDPIARSWLTLFFSGKGLLEAPESAAGLLAPVQVPVGVAPTVATPSVAIVPPT